MGEIERRILGALGTSRLLVPAPVGLLRVPVFIMEKTLPGSPVSTSLLELLAVPNTVKDNALVTYFKIEPRPFAGENITYLRNNRVGDTLRKLFTGATVN
jgi:hypothetical protein